MKHGGQYIRVHLCQLQLKIKNDQSNIQSVSACKFDNKPNELSAVEPENSDSNIQGFPNSIKRWGGRWGRLEILLEGEGGDLHKEFFFDLLRLL